MSTQLNLTPLPLLQPHANASAALKAASFKSASFKSASRKPGRPAGGNSGESPEADLSSVFRRHEDFESQERSTAARLSLTGVHLVDGALQLFELLPRLAKLAFRRQALVVGKVFGGFCDERVQIRCGLGRGGGCRGCRSGSRWLRRAQRRGGSAKEGRQRRLEGWSVREPVLKREHNEAQLRHRAPLGLEGNRLRIQCRAPGPNRHPVPHAHPPTLLFPPPH